MGIAKAKRIVNMVRVFRCVVVDALILGVKNEKNEKDPKNIFNDCGMKHATRHIAWSVERGAWSVERGAWSVERGAWSVERGA